MHILSKSTYMRGRQCEKALYLLKNRRDLVPPVSDAQQAIFSQGTTVGELAWQLYPGGVDCSAADHKLYAPALEATRHALATADLIYEAAFLYNEVLAVMDILVRDGDGWRAIEVKSSTSVKAQFVEDAALQYHVISNSGVRLKDIGILHIDNRYVRQGPIEPAKLFHLEDVTGPVRAVQEDVAATIHRLKTMLARGQEPVVAIGPHCDNPYPCDLKGHCWKEVPVPSVLDLARGKSLGFELFGQGILRLEDIPDDVPLTARQQMQVMVQRSGTPVVNTLPIGHFLARLEYPVHCLDFETFALAVPPYDGTRPYQAIPFQYSLHVIDAPGAEPRHLEYLADGASDPRPELLARLLQDIGPAGSVLAYNLSFERSVLAQLALAFPEHAPGIQRVIGRCTDLAIPFANQWYYHQGMNGRYSIKQVLPALVPEFGYTGMDVADGMTASNLFAQLIQGRFTGDTQKLRADLLAYCKMDTLAMVKLLQVLEREMVRKPDRGLDGPV